MRIQSYVGALTAASLLLVAADWAAAQECVRVAGYESSGEKLSMDPADQLSSDDALLVLAVYNRLVDLDDKFEVVPELAESWEASDDGKTWTFHLRKGVKFHDGSDFDANDVVYSFRRLLDPALASPALGNLTFLESEGINALDSHTVQFTTDKAISEMPLLLSLKFNLIVAEGATHEELRLHGNGTGPFIQEQFEPGGAIRILRRNPNYWREGLPKAECLQSSIILEPLTAVLALQSGDVDVVTNIEPSLLGMLADDPNVTLLTTGAGSSHTVVMLIDTPPFDNIKVRQALKLVADRQLIVDTVLLGYAEPGNDNPVPPSWPSAFSSEPLQRDVAKAKQLLAEAGHPDGLTVDLFTADAAPNMVKVVEAYAEMAKEAGITINIVKTPADSFWDDVWMQRSFFSSQWFIRPPAEGLSLAYTKASTWNESHWFRDDYEALLNQASAELDPEKRTQIYKEAQRMLAEEGGSIFLAFVHQIAGMRKECSGYVPHAQAANMNFEEISCTR